jgi:hypothetical protein
MMSAIWSEEGGRGSGAGWRGVLSGCTSTERGVDALDREK